MAEDTLAAEAAAAQVQLVVDERDMRTAFANGYRIYTTGEEVVVDVEVEVEVLVADAPPPPPAATGAVVVVVPV